MGNVQKFFSKIFGTSEKDKIRENILNEDIDFGNIVSSSLLAKGLYDELKKIKSERGMGALGSSNK